MCRKLMYISILLAGLVLMALPVTAADGDTPAAGELVINEIMIDTAAVAIGGIERGEWIEIVNISGETRDLNTCSITDGEGTYTWNSSTIVQAGEYYLLCYDNTVANAPSGCDTVYGGDAGSLKLGNSGDSLTLSCGATTIDRVPGSGDWASTFDNEGQSQEFSSRGGTPATENDTTSNKCNASGYWCDTPNQAQYNYAGSEYGTPGAKNTDWMGPTAIRLVSLEASSVPVSFTPALFFIGLCLLISGTIRLIGCRRHSQVSH